jgi:beta-glucosidase
MVPNRRTVLQGGAALAGLAGAGAPSAAAQAAPRPAPSGFLWGTAISAYQSEGGNTNTDTWLLETMTSTVYADRSGDACDSYHRFREDIALNAALGFNCYRFGVEWARIEPTPGQISEAELDHYERVLEACHVHGQTPVVTYNHFSAPRWFSERGGWERDDAPDLFARYCQRTTGRLGPLIGMATPFNEANILGLVQLLGKSPERLELERRMIAAARRATGSPRFCALAYSDPEVSGPILLQAHARGYQAIKAERSSLPVGVSLTPQQLDAVGEGVDPAALQARLYGGWIQAARLHADFVGVQTYTRFSFDRSGLLKSPAGAELTAVGYEFYPEALAGTIRWAHRTFAKPIYVTESGLATDDDTRRVAYVDQALAGVRACLAEGIAVKGYLYWSLLDNYEWTSGYRPHFGLVAVDRRTFRRTPRPSAFHLGRRARANLI